MRRIVIFAAVLLAGQAFAQAIPARGAQFGRFTTEMTPQQAVDVVPNAAWQKTRDRDTEELKLATLANGVEFAGKVWDLSIGEEYKFNDINFDLRRKFSYSKKEECEAAMTATVGALEPVYGPFGQHPLFVKRS